MLNHLPEETEIELPGLKLAAKVWGPPDGVRTIALHGWLDNAASFDRLAPLLFGVRLVVPDLPGHGRSGHRPEGASYHFVDWVGDVMAAADALGWERFSLLGHSMGAAIATLTAGCFPDRVERLVLLEGLGPLTAESKDSPQRLADGILQLRKIAAKAHQRPYPSQADMIPRMLQSRPGLSRESAELLVARASVETPSGWVWSADRRLRAPSLYRMTRGQVQAFLERVSCPALVVRAKGGYPFDPALGRSQLAALADARVAEVDGGHHVHMDDPHRIAEVVELFYASTHSSRIRT